MVFGRQPNQLLGSAENSTEVKTFGSNSKPPKGSTEVKTFGSNTNPRKESVTVPPKESVTVPPKESVTVPVPDDDTRPSKPQRPTGDDIDRNGDDDNSLPNEDVTKEDKNELTEPPAPVNRGPTENLLKLPKVRAAREADFLAKLDPIKKATANLQKKTLPGLKRLNQNMKRALDRALKQMDARLKRILNDIKRSKKMTDIEKADAKRRAEQSVAAAKSEIELYANKLNARIPKLMSTIDNTKLYGEIEKLLSGYSTRQVDALNELANMVKTFQDGMNERFSVAESVFKAAVA